MHNAYGRTVIVWVAATSLIVASMAEQRRTDFSDDPGWDGHNNQPQASSSRTVVQDFGYAITSHDGKTPGEVGGVNTPDGRPAYYAKEISQTSFGDAFSASGTVVVNKGAGNTLLGFFNHDTINEWRTPNSIVFRINGRGDFFHVHFEYATSLWRAGAGVIGRYDKDADRMYPLEIPSEGVHTWSLSYDPNGNSGGGRIDATFDGVTAVCNLGEGHKADGATFDRFGLLNVNKSVDSPGELWIDDVVINGQAESFASDPKWRGLNNRDTYESKEVRPWFNVGYSASSYCGGTTPGEIGGLFYRGDCRYPERMGYYADRVANLTLNAPLQASGRLTLHRAVSDSTTLFGFFHSEHSVEVNPSQRSALPKDFLGLSIEGPSSAGFYVYPMYRNHGDNEGSTYGEKPLHILPNRSIHQWTLTYDPTGADGLGNIVVELDGNRVELPLEANAKSVGALFNRFGFITTWIDGNGQVVYFDDIEYTCKHGAT